MAYFQTLHPVLQAFLATCFTWGITALGAAAVLLVRPLLPYALSLCCRSNDFCCRGGACS